MHLLECKWKDNWYCSSECLKSLHIWSCSQASFLLLESVCHLFLFLLYRSQYPFGKRIFLSLFLNNTIFFSHYTIISLEFPCVRVTKWKVVYINSAFPGLHQLNKGCKNFNSIPGCSYLNLESQIISSDLMIQVLPKIW